MKDFVNEFFFNPEPLEDIDTDPLEDTDTDTEGHPDQFSEYNLFNVDFSAAVQITHANVERALKDRCSSKSGLLEFYTDWTGRGKTSGVILSTGKMFQRGMVSRVLFITREKAGVDDVWRQFAATWPDLNVVGFSSSHRSHNKEPARFALYRDDVKTSELKPAQVVITTHAMAKVWMQKEDWQAGKNFDLVICDEYPDPVKADTVTLGDIEAWERDCYDTTRSAVLADVLEWAHQVYTKGMALKPTWLDKIDDTYPERLQQMVAAIKAGRMFATKTNNPLSRTVLQWADLEVPFENKAIIFSATNDVEGWQFDPNVTDKIVFNAIQQPTIYTDLRVTFADWPSGVPTNNKTLGGHVAASLRAIEKALAQLPSDGEDALVLAPKTLCDAIPEGWLDSASAGRKVMLKNWGAGIGSNAYKECHHMVIFGHHHPNKLGLKTAHMGHSRYQSDGDDLEVGTLEDKALKIVRANHYTRWVVQMLNRIRIRKMVSDERGLDMYKAQAGNIIWIATDKDQDIAKKILVKNFVGCQITEVTGESVFEDFDEVARVKSLKTTEERVGFILTKLTREGVDTVTLTDLKNRFGWKAENQKTRAKAIKAALEHGWQYIPSEGGSRNNQAKYQRL